LDEKEAVLWRLVNKDYVDTPLILEALAQGYMHTQRWPDALRCLQRLAQGSPDNANFLVWRGWAQENMGRTDPALEDFRRATELDPEHEQAHLSLAEMLMQSNKPAEATEQYEWVLRRRPQDVAALLGLARCRRQTGQLDQACRALDEVLARE